MSTPIVQTFLEANGLGHLWESFSAHEFDTLDVVLAATEDDLVAMGITKVGTRRKVMLAILREKQRRQFHANASHEDGPSYGSTNQSSNGSRVYDSSFRSRFRLLADRQGSASRNPSGGGYDAYAALRQHQYALDAQDAAHSAYGQQWLEDLPQTRPEERQKIDQIARELDERHQRLKEQEQALHARMLEMRSKDALIASLQEQIQQCSPTHSPPASPSFRGANTQAAGATAASLPSNITATQEQITFGGEEGATVDDIVMEEEQNTNNDVNGNQDQQNESQPQDAQKSEVLVKEDFSFPPVAGGGVAAVREVPPRPPTPVEVEQEHPLPATEAVRSTSVASHPAAQPVDVEAAATNVPPVQSSSRRSSAAERRASVRIMDVSEDDATPHIPSLQGAATRGAPSQAVVPPTSIANGAVEASALAAHDESTIGDQRRASSRTDTTTGGEAQQPTRRLSVRSMRRKSLGDENYVHGVEAALEDLDFVDKGNRAHARTVGDESAETSTLEANKVYATAGQNLLDWTERAHASMRSAFDTATDIQTEKQETRDEFVEMLRRFTQGSPLYAYAKENLYGKTNPAQFGEGFNPVHTALNRPATAPASSLPRLLRGELTRNGGMSPSKTTDTSAGASKLGQVQNLSVKANLNRLLAEQAEQERRQLQCDREYKKMLSGFFAQQEESLRGLGVLSGDERMFGERWAPRDI